MGAMTRGGGSGPVIFEKIEPCFFWDGEAFQALRESIAPKIAARRGGRSRYLRIWSAGCATGEEPFSIAIALHESMPDIDSWSVTLLATDVNPDLLQSAARGVYPERALRELPDSVRARYFVPQGDGSCRICDRLRSMVDFRLLSLAEDPYPSLLSNTNAMDLVFCRNVLMHLAPETAQRVVQRLARTLAEDGVLVVSPVEVPRVLSAPLSPLKATGDSLLLKRSCDAVPVAVGSTFPLRSSSAESKGESDKSYARALELFNSGSYERACGASFRALRGEVVRGKVLSLLARAHANLGRLSLAREWCKRAIRADRLDPAHHYLLAMILEEQRDFAGAGLSLQRALYADPRFVLAHFSLAYSYLRTGRRREAEKHLRTARLLLDGRAKDETLNESEGCTVGRIEEAIRMMMGGPEFI